VRLKTNKKTTGRPFWLRVAAMAEPEASASTMNGEYSSTALTKVYSMSFFKLLKAG